MGKKILAGIAGVVVAVLIVWLVESIGHAVYPPPPDLSFADPEAMQDYMATLPIGAFLFVGGAWFLGALGGTVTACRIGDAKAMIYALLVGGLMLLAAAANIAMIPHPIWFSIVGLAGIVVAAWVGMKIGTGLQSEAK